MPRVFTFDEIPDSREESVRGGNFTMKFVASGEQDNDVVLGYAAALTAAQVLRPYGLLFRQDIQIDPVGWALYEVTVPYGPLERAVGTVAFSFDTSGATVNIKGAKEHIKSYPTDGDFHKGAIGVRGDGEVEGIDIVVPALSLTYTYRHPAGVITEAQARQLASITGCTNSEPFRGFEAEELLFVGASGSDGTDAEAEIAYGFIAQANVTDLSIGEITGIAKKGHHALWIDFKDEVDAGQAMRRPRAVHIERVYDAVDFAAVLGWS